MALSDKCSRLSQGASLLPSCPQFRISCWQHTLQGLFLCHLSGYEEEGSALLRAELGSSPFIIKMEEPKRGTPRGAWPVGKSFSQHCNPSAAPPEGGVGSTARAPKLRGERTLPRKDCPPPAGLQWFKDFVTNE